MAKKRKDKPQCQWQTLTEALSVFALNAAGHQGSGHIRPLHWYVACRLVIEGGFHPSDVSPRPPFEVVRSGGRSLLEYAPNSAGGDERIVLGGLKTKSIDVVVAKDGIGPVIAVSMKGTLNAFRNLTNRMEEAVGDCTNLHIAYPALVYGFLHVLRGNFEGKGMSPNDVAIGDTGVSDSILRYHDVMTRLTGRNDVRDVTTKYEAVAIALVDTRPKQIGTLFPGFPQGKSLLEFSNFFDQLYRQYDSRFVYAAPLLAKKTRRLEWDPDSSALAEFRSPEYRPRLRNLTWPSSDSGEPSNDPQE
jgi:hypothetical protein